MRIIADFHIHSRYARACSKNISVDSLAEWASLKGINILGTGDFTHHLWLKELKENLEPLGNGFYVYKKYPNLKWVLTGEISSIYKQADKVRKIHTIILAPSFKTVEEINTQLAKIGNIHSDGRPILGISARDLTKLVLNIDPTCMIIPAHAWTPWFSIFGSKSGFDTIEECFLDLTPKIHAIETGLSSDPEMNWRLSKLDPISLISCSDAHSPANLGREATVFEFKSEKDVTYNNVCDAIKSSRSKKLKVDGCKLISTLEFFPEEGMYHFDGHRNCGNISMSPEESGKLNHKCPKCQKSLTIGVLHRVQDLADRPTGYQPKNFPSSLHLVPLQEIIAESYGVGKSSKKVQEEYNRIVNQVGNEFEILLYKSIDELKMQINPRIVDGIKRVREGEVQAIPGYDGVYGKVKVFKGDKNEQESGQTSLFR